MNTIGETIAFIPIRGGSKSIPLKNIKLLNKRPLVYWVLDAATKCDDIEKIIVSTDSQEIKLVIEQYPSDKVIAIDRSLNVSTDSASTESVMLEFAENYSFKNIILIQATSPLLESEHLYDGLKKFRSVGTDSVLSVVRQKRFIWEKTIDGFKPANYNPLKRPRRQEFPGFFVENGAFYITSRERLLNSKCRISGKVDYVEMPEESYFEIDEPSDWLIVESLLSNNKKHLKLKNNIKCIITDCDGVLTDGGMYYFENGDEAKKFNTLDGMAFQIVKEHGLLTGIITGESCASVRRRSQKLKVDIYFEGIKDKSLVLDQICRDYKIKPEEIAYVGDDINDIGIMKLVGYSCAVANADQKVKEIADYITMSYGGSGAFREVVKHLFEV